MTDRQGPQGTETDRRPVPDLVLERSRLDELPAVERDALRQRTDAEPELTERLAALERSDTELRRRFEAARMATRVRARLATLGEDLGEPRETWWRPWPLTAGLAITATAALVMALRTTVPAPRFDPPATPAPPVSSAPAAISSPPAANRPAHSPSSAVPAPLPPTSEPGVRLKGLRPALTLFRKTSEGSETLADGDLARQGDLIRIGYRAVGRRYGVIVSLDGRGGVTRHLPERGSAAALLEARDVVLLAHAYRLDDAPAWERFFFVTADAPFPVAAVENAARQAAGGPGGAPAQAPAALPLPDGLQQSTFVLTKE